jgi:hypothetical protein
MTSILEEYRTKSPKGALHKPKESILDRYRTSKDVSTATDIVQQIPRGTIKGLGAYGNVKEMLHLNPEEYLTESQKLQAERESANPPERLAEEIVETEGPPATTGRLPTSEDIDKFLDMIGYEKGKTPAGRVVGSGSEAITGSAQFAGTPLQLLLAGGGAISGQSLREAGAPGWLATAVDTGINLYELIKQAPKLLKKIPLKKSSGLSERKFEKLEKPTKVMVGTKEKAIEEVGKEFKDIAEDIQSSTNKSLKGFREDPYFEAKLSEGYEKLTESGSKIAKKTPSDSYQKFLGQEYKKIGGKGFEASDTERFIKKDLKKSIGKSAYKDFYFNELTDQYKKNNKELRKYLPYGLDAVKNEAKREALLAKNRAIAKTIEKDFGSFPEAKDFKFLNERWSEVQKIKTVDSFVNSIFTKEGINFKAAQKALSGKSKAQNLENAIGKQNFTRFKGLVSDLMEQEAGMKMLKAKGFTLDDIGSLGQAALFKPKLAKTKAVYDVMAKFWRRGLGDPEFTRDWGRAVELFHKGRITESLNVLNALEKSVEEED